MSAVLKIDRNVPHVDLPSFIPLTEAEGVRLHSYITDHALADVLAENYFGKGARQLMRFDRILAVTDAGGPKPVHSTLIVVSVDSDKWRVTVAEL